MQKIMVQFDFPSVTSMQYDNVWNDLKAQGHGQPKGLLYHVGAPKPDGGWTVTDVWESQEAFNNFRNILLPLLQKNDVPLVAPRIYSVYNIYETKIVLA